MEDKLIDLSQNLIKIINETTQSIYQYSYHQSQTNKYNFHYTQNEYQNEKINKLNKIKNQETYFDKLYETYSRCLLVCQQEQMFRKMYEEFLYRIDTYFVECRNKKEQIGDELNKLLDEMKESEKEIQKDCFTEDIEEMNFNLYYAETVAYKMKKENEKRMKEIELLKKTQDEQKEKRHKLLSYHISKNEMELLEKELGRYADDLLFDSKIDNWETNNSVFASKIMNQSKLFIFVHAVDGRTIGCYVDSEINVIGKYISDANSYIFKFENGDLQKYPLIDTKMAIKICSDKDDDLFICGKNDIVIKKVDKRDKCTCKQTSFDYQGLTNTLIGKIGTFEINRVSVVSTINFIELEQQIEQIIHPSQTIMNEETKIINQNEIETETILEIDTDNKTKSIHSKENNTSILNKSMKDSNVKINPQSKNNTEINETKQNISKNLFSFKTETSKQKKKKETLFNKHKTSPMNKTISFQSKQLNQTQIPIQQKLVKQPQDQKNKIKKVFNEIINEKQKEPIQRIDEKRYVYLKRLENMKQTNQIQIKQFEQWTSLKCDEILFDNEIDDWNVDTSIFNQRIIGKKHLLFLIEDENGEKFGYYLNTLLEEKYWKRPTDNKSFHFNLESKENRLNQPMKYEIKDTSSGYCLFKENDDYLIWIGDIWIAKESKKTKSYTRQNENNFDYYSIPKALNGSIAFIPKRIIVFQMANPSEQRISFSSRMSFINNVNKGTDENENKTQQMKPMRQSFIVKKQKNQELIEKRRQCYIEMRKTCQKEIFQLEIWSNKLFNKIIFDSTIDEWSKDSSNFNECIIGKKHLMFLIESEDGEKFGYYLNSKVIDKIDTPIETDSNSFHFNLKSQNNRLSKPMKFKIKDSINNGIWLYPQTNESLVLIGHIYLKKKEYTETSLCRQNEFHFEYNDIPNALCGKTHMDGGCFTPKRITVIQMKDYKNDTKQIEEWTKLHWGETLFDSKFENWSKETSVLNEKIIGKSKLVFLIEDENDEQFGYYLHSEIEEKYEWNTTESKSFLFNLESHGRLETPMKFGIKDVKWGYCLVDKHQDILIILGDIVLMKEEEKKKSHCYQTTRFNYQGIDKVLCGKEKTGENDEMYFNPKRILVVQMI